MIPMVQCRHDGHVVGFQHVQSWGENVGQLSFVNENGGLSFAHGEFGAVFNFMAFAFKSPNNCVTGVINPMNDIDKFARQKIKNSYCSTFPY
jgi:hypothetical protein